MKRTLALLLLLTTGCSNAPIAGTMDRFWPSHVTVPPPTPSPATSPLLSGPPPPPAPPPSTPPPPPAPPPA
jgi:Wiskott-Aldrich syndrome protein